MGRIAFLIFVLLYEVSAAQPAKTIKLGELQEVMTEASSSIHIINFWATWCGPCIKELPVFEKITAAGNPDIKVTLVSLDLDLDPDPQKVYRFIERKNLQSEVLLLDAPDPNSWISKIDKEWSGALPATILVNHKTGKRKFIGRALHEGELERHIEEIQ